MSRSLLLGLIFVTGCGGGSFSNAPPDPDVETGGGPSPVESLAQPLGIGGSAAAIDATGGAKPTATSEARMATGGSIAVISSAISIATGGAIAAATGGAQSTCAVGSLGCKCTAAGTCSAPLSCATNGVCVGLDPNAGQIGARCATGGTCKDDGSCLRDGYCHPSGSADGHLNNPCLFDGTCFDPVESAQPVCRGGVCVGPG